MCLQKRIRVDPIAKKQIEHMSGRISGWQKTHRINKSYSVPPIPTAMSSLSRLDTPMG